VRGLIESNGFTNKSEDILGVFVWACSLIGIRARRANAINVSIARHPDVCTLDEAFARPAFRPWGWLANDPGFLGRTLSRKVS